MNVTLIDWTRYADLMLILTKRTRLLGEKSWEETWHELCDMTQEERDEELDTIFSTIESPLEFVDYTFLIQGVTRAFTHQLVRTRTGSYAQQSQRAVGMADFAYSWTGQGEEPGKYIAAMDGINDCYKEMLEEGVDPQDARGILPTNIHTNIVAKFSLRTLKDMMGLRLCFRTQGEYQQVALEVKKAVLEVHPWAERAFLPYCLQRGSCFFPRFEDCPLKQEFPQLQPFHSSSQKEVDWMRGFWKSRIGTTSIQPEVKK